MCIRDRNDFFCDYKWQKLGTAAAYYGYHFRAHDSLEDVRATLYIFDQMQHSNKRELFEDYFWEDSEDEFDAVSYTHLPDYSAYSENYMGNPEKTTGLFSMDYDRLSEDTAQIYKQQFRQAQENGSLLWQTVLSFDNQWLEELEIYDPTSQTLDESRVRGMTRVFMKTLLDKEQLTLASWTAAVHYNTDNIHVHVAIVDPVGQRERVPDRLSLIHI